MNFVTLAAIVTCIIFGLFTLFLVRKSLLLLILLPASQFLGFLDPMAIAIKGAFDIHAFIAFFIVITILSSLRALKDLRGAYLIRPVSVFIILYIFGVAYPVINNNSSWFYAFKASKEFLMIFIYFAVFLHIKTKQDIEASWRIILFFGIYYSILEFLSQIIRGKLLGHIVYASRPEDLFFIKIYPPFWPLILISLLYYTFNNILIKKGNKLYLVISFVGLGLTFFRSYLLGAFFAVPAVLLLSGRKVFNIIKAMTISGVLLLTLIGILDSFSNSEISIMDKMVLSGIEEITTQSGGALAGRKIFTKQRLELLEKNPLLGFGFIDKDSFFGRTMQKHIVGDLLGFIDDGTVDLKMKFGYIGMFITYLTALYFIYKLLKLSKMNIGPTLQARALTVAALAIIYLAVQPVHAPFSNSFGIIPLFITLALIDREYKLVMSDKNDLYA